MDGVLYRGDAPLPHVSEFLSTLDRCGIPYVLATNNSMSTPQQYVAKLAKMGISVREDLIFTSGLATRAWLQARHPRGTKVFVIGMPALEAAIFDDGYFVPGGQDAQVVVNGLDLTVNYDKLKTATLAIRRGAVYVATNADNTLPTEEGLVPGSGSIVAALIAASGVAPEVIGKPSTGIVEASAAKIGTSAQETVMLGDRLDTDILAGERAGFITALVLTGVTHADELATSTVSPDVVLPDLSPLIELYGRC
jgi:4-nitrophenyl phosphatase